MIGPVVLVGLMGSGKTTVGRRLARRLDRPFADADEVVVERAGCTISELFATQGEAVFRVMESEVLAELLDGQPSVIAAGGGVVVVEANRELLRRSEVTVVWLDGSPSFLASRADAKASRPLLTGSDDQRAVFERLHAERASWYEEVADIRVDIEPFHAGEGKAKRALADHLAERVIAREGVAA
jgi:shikimate kinase